MADGRIVYVSCAADKEIRVLAMDRDSGALRALGSVPVRGTGEPSPSSLPLAVSPDRRFLYAALRTPPYPVTSFAIDRATGGLTPMGNAALADSMAYIVTDRTGQHLLSASYPGAKLASNRIDRFGCVNAAPTQLVPTAPKAHSILPSLDNRFVYAAVLGGDHVMQFTFDAATGSLTHVTPDTRTAESAGPRHLRFHPRENLMFSVDETGGTVTTYARDPQSGRLTRLGEVSAMPDGEITAGQAAASDLQITPDGRFLYATVRATSTVAGFAIEGEALRRIGTWSVPAVPRGIAIDPDGRFLLAAGLETNTLAVLAIDARGALAPRAQYATAGMPNWIEIVDLPPA